MKNGYNFTTNKDKIAALKLLDKLTYVSNQDLTNLIDASNNLLRSSLDLDNSTDYYISSTGNLTSGSTHLARHFQKGTKIRKELFKSSEELTSLIEKHKIGTLILIDDFIGSGDTYIKWSKDNDLLLNSCSKIIYLSLIGLQKGIENIQQKNKIEVLSAHILDESDQVINGTLFAEEKQEIIELIEKYSKRIKAQYIYGYDNCQLLLAFENHIPNNSIGILWWNSQWTHLFER